MFNIDSFNSISKEIKDLGKKTQIVAVSKNHPRSSVEQALKCGVRIFGENRVQEAKAKFTNLKETYSNLELHLTGSLQTNKVKDAIKIFDVFHTLDREKLAKEFVKFKIFDVKNIFSFKYSLFPLIEALYQGSPPITFTNDPTVSLIVEGPSTGRTI